MLERELGRFKDGLLYCLFDTPDRMQHLFWRFLEPDHPANRGRSDVGQYGSVIDDAYRRGDAVVGRVLEHVDDQTLVIVLSDHGFNSVPARGGLERLAAPARPADAEAGASSRATGRAICFRGWTGRARRLMPWA